MKEKISNNIQIKNKRATFDYELLDTFTAGIVLTGTEIKSIRLGKASLVDTFCIMEKGELWVKNMYIAEYFYGTYNNHVARRDRKLLLTKKELRKIDSAARNSGFTIIPTVCSLMKKGWRKWLSLLLKVRRNTISAIPSKPVTISGRWTGHSNGKKYSCRFSFHKETTYL
jgi:SsrA-binding protein